MVGLRSTSWCSAEGGKWWYLVKLKMVTVSKKVRRSKLSLQTVVHSNPELMISVGHWMEGLLHTLVVYLWCCSAEGIDDPHSFVLTMQSKQWRSYGLVYRTSVLKWSYGSSEEGWGPDEVLKVEGGKWCDMILYLWWSWSNSWYPTKWWYL